MLQWASDIALAFLTDYPTPEAAARLGQARLAAFCRRHAYRGGKPPAELLGRLRTAPVRANRAGASGAGPADPRPGPAAARLQATIGELETGSPSGSPGTHGPSS